MSTAGLYDFTKCKVLIKDRRDMSSEARRRECDVAVLCTAACEKCRSRRSCEWGCDNSSLRQKNDRCTLDQGPLSAMRHDSLAGQARTHMMFLYFSSGKAP